MHPSPSKLRWTAVRVLALPAVAVLLAALPARGQDRWQQALAALPENRAAGASTFSVEQQRAWLVRLTSEEFAGRATGTDGFRLAAEMVRDHFHELGLEPGAEDGRFWQTVPWNASAAKLGACFIRVSRGDDRLWEITAEDGLWGTASAATDLAGDLVLCVSDTPDGADLAGLPLADRLVIVVGKQGFAGAEGQSRGDAGTLLYYAVRNALRVRQTVADAGGRLLALCDAKLHDAFGTLRLASGPSRRSAGPAGAARQRAPQTLCLTRDALAAMLAAIGQEVDLAAATAPAAIDLPGIRATCRIEITRGEAPAYNVLGILRGSDPELAQEFVGVGCHLDHLGTRGGQLRPGADDDGSGVVGVMSIAQAFVANGKRPKRSILFMAFCGEEDGLIGSRYFAAHPTVPLESMVAELQIDMIGRDADSGREKAENNKNSVYLIGSDRLSSDLHETCLRLNEEHAGFDVKLENVQDVFRRSDHFNFAKEGVPIVFFFTGFHRDYHRPSDTVDKINFDKLRRIAMLVYDVAWELADADSRPLVDPEKWAALEGKGRSRPVAPLREKAGGRR